MKRLLITDTNEEVRLALAERLAGQYQIRLCGEGNGTLALLRSFRPHLLVLDMELPGLDGISLLQWAVEEGVGPVTLGTFRYEMPYGPEKLSALGIAYLMRKPCNLRAMEQRLADLAELEPPGPMPAPADGRNWVTNLLLELGMPCKRRGFQCLIEAVLEMEREPTQQITKSLYPRVAALCDGSSRQVERAIRATIEVAWANRDRELWSRRLPAALCMGEARPSNAAFICALASMLAAGEGEAQRFSHAG